MSRTAKEINNFLASVVNDPLRYVMGAFPWNTDPAIQVVPLQGKYKEMFPNTEYGPDVWQCEYLEEFGRQLKETHFDGVEPCLPIRFSTVSGHGPGKSALVGMLVKFILDTRPFSVGTVTANTAPQLRTKTWAEVGKWHLRSMTKDRFRYYNSTNSMTLVHVDPKLGLNWKCTAQTCDPANSEAFAGQHASNSTSFYIFDEASNIPDKLFEVREGGLASGQPVCMDFGNGTRNTGRFFENTVGRYKRQYTRFHIDSRQAYRVNKKKVQDDIDTYGIDSDWIKVRWLGQFPSSADTQFLSSESVDEAMTREIAVNHKAETLVLGVDVAKSLTGDNSIIYPRIGYDCRSFAPRRARRGSSPKEIALAVSQYIQEFSDIGLECDKVFVDGGGGYGWSVVSYLQDFGVKVVEVNPGEKANRRATYALRVDECWGGIRENIEKLMLPKYNTQDGKELHEQLTQRQAGHTLKEQVRLESKDDFKARIGCSPDIADALALTFADPVFKIGAYNGGSDATIIQPKED